METLVTICFKVAGGLLDFLLLGQFDYLIAKRKLKHLQATRIIETQKPFDKNTVKHMLEDPSIRPYLFSKTNYKKLLHDKDMQKQFNEGICKYI
ncbi:hypothetical protein [Anoxybacteroides amylolyticum]|uniref:Uncharacterized protein n=1 Tax=Anoxybacteroides amylolyticum TaxID=294699 RepID=A0A160F566_9BACL|nr:hypothetical protein [Anoxybacillus amylolyticus]ANB60965.1 hypothetical protein GFC30_1667 [Anoxybacillus amylolyticus]